MTEKNTRESRGFGFVTFSDDAAVDACLKSANRLLGRPVSYFIYSYINLCRLIVNQLFLKLSAKGLEI